MDSEANSKAQTVVRKRTSGVPTGNAGEYFVMGELLRRGYDAQLADRNTKGYDLLVGFSKDPTLRKAQVKTVRNPPWYVSLVGFEGEMMERETIYVLLGPVKTAKPVRYFITKNADIYENIHFPKTWDKVGFVNLKMVEPYEGRWDLLFGSK